MELAEFLLARIAEDEAVAREAGPELATYRGGITSDLAYSTEYGHVIVEAARVLAECDAKRRIVELAEGSINDLTWIAVGADTTDSGDTDVDQQVLRLLALPYADREGFREEWRALVS